MNKPRESAVHEAPHEGAFDDNTDADSRAIAVRFAPEGRDTRSVEPPRREPRLPVPRTDQSAEETYKRPPHSILKRPPAPGSATDPSQSMLRDQAAMLSDVLADFGVKGEIKDIHPARS